MIAPKKITLTIDGRRCEGQEGQTILQIAQANGISIPTLCYLKHLSPWGGCRMCIVEIVGSPKVVPACSTPAVDGKQVVTNSESLQKLRRSTLELLFSERNHICPFCVMNKGDCELQHQGYRHGIDAISIPYLYPALAGGRVGQIPRPRPQPLHPVHPLRAHLRGNGRHPHARYFQSRREQPRRRGPRRDVRHVGHLHELRRVRRGVSHRGAVRQGRRVPRQAQHLPDRSHHVHRVPRRLRPAGLYEGKPHRRSLRRFRFAGQPADTCACAAVTKPGPNRASASCSRWSAATENWSRPPGTKPSRPCGRPPKRPSPPRKPCSFRRA